MDRFTHVSEKRPLSHPTHREIQCVRDSTVPTIVSRPCLPDLARWSFSNKVSPVPAPDTKAVTRRTSCLQGIGGSELRASGKSCDARSASPTSFPTGSAEFPILCSTHPIGEECVDCTQTPSPASAIRQTGAGYSCFTQAHAFVRIVPSMTETKHVIRSLGRCPLPASRDFLFPRRGEPIMFPRFAK